MALLLLAGCYSIRPRPLTRAEMVEKNITEIAGVRGAQEPVTITVTLEEAMARALKYNLELKVKRIEQAMSLNLLAATKGDMLPKLLGQIGYTERDNDRISLSRDTTTAGAPLVPSRFVSQERSHTFHELGLNWSVLDFGVGYLRSKQQADRVLIASERRRKAMHLVLQDVRTAYWRLASAQSMEARLTTTVAAAEQALILARAAGTNGDKDPATAARYQRSLLENLRLLDALKQELSTAQVDLAVLINCPPDQRVTVAEPPVDEEPLPAIGLPIEQLEQTALGQNPDLIEQHYSARIARLEARSALLRMFPNLSLGYSLNYDSDRYLVNQSWQQASAQISYNFLSLLSLPAIKAYGKAGIAQADERRHLAQVAVLAQVHLARLQVLTAQQQLSRAREINEIDARLAKIAGDRMNAEADDTLEIVSARTAALLSKLRYYQARSSLQTAHARLLATLGAEPEIPSVTDTSVAQLAEILRQAQPNLAPAAAPALPTP